MSAACTTKLRNGVSEWRRAPSPSPIGMRRRSNSNTRSDVARTKSDTGAGAVRDAFPRVGTPDDCTVEVGLAYNHGDRIRAVKVCRYKTTQL